jgi:hypothetical protein
MEILAQTTSIHGLVRDETMPLQACPLLYTSDLYHQDQNLTAALQMFPQNLVEVRHKSALKTLNPSSYWVA